jgi:dolichol kinase
LLVVLATLLAVVTTLTTWTRSQALDTDQWVEVSSDLLNEPQVQQALAIYLTDELYRSVDVTGELESVLPDNLSGLAGPLAGALRGPTTDGIEKIIASSAFQTVWQDANRVAHEAAVRILRDESNIDSISTSDGAIVLNLNTAVVNLGEAVGIPQSALDRLPADVGQITILQSNELSDAQNAVKVLDFTSWFLFVVVVAMYVVAVYLAVDRRRQMLRSVGIALIVGGVTLLLLRRVGIRVSVNRFVEDATNKPLAELVGSVLTELLRQLAWTGIVYGLLIIGFSVLIGPHRWAVAFRRWAAGVADSTAALVGISFGAVLLLLWWSPGRAFDRWTTAIVLVALVVGAVYTLVLTGRGELLAADAGLSGPDPQVDEAEEISETVS